MTIYGYMRVSSRDQNEGRQLAALTEYGVAPENIFCDKQSGKDFDRAQYQLLVSHTLLQGDLLIVKSIDRLGRNYEEILEEWRRITKIKKTDIIILDMPLLNTCSTKDLTGTLIADVVLQLLSYVAQNEREAIHQRQCEGIALAKQKGVRFGRPTEPPSPSFFPLWESYRLGRLPMAEVVKRAGISRATFYRWEKKLRTSV